MNYVDKLERQQRCDHAWREWRPHPTSPYLDVRECPRCDLWQARDRVQAPVGENATSGQEDTI